MTDTPDADLDPPGSKEVSIQLFAGSGGKLISPQMTTVREFQDDEGLVAGFEALLARKRKQLNRHLGG